MTPSVYKLDCDACDGDSLQKSSSTFLGYPNCVKCYLLLCGFSGCFYLFGLVSCDNKPTGIHDPLAKLLARVD